MIDLTELTQAEQLALKVGLGQIQRGRSPMPNISTVCIMALARLTGLDDGEPDD